MIKSDKGTIKIKGNITEIGADIVGLVSSLKSMFMDEDKLNSGKAEELVMLFVNEGFTEADVVRNETNG